MAFPRELLETFNAAEIHFLAENEPVEITSNVQMDKVSLITTELPKLRLMTTYKIPAWLAVILRKQNKVTVAPPEWLNEKYLSNKYQEETLNPGSFSKLPPNWLELSQIYLKNFHQDLIDETDVILKLVQDLKEIRLVKLRKGLQNLNELNLSFNDLSMMEINEFRPFISKVMGRLSRLNKTLEINEPDTRVRDYEEDEQQPAATAFLFDESQDNKDDIAVADESRREPELDGFEETQDLEMEDIVNEFEL